MPQRGPEIPSRAGKGETAVKKRLCVLWLLLPALLFSGACSVWAAGASGAEKTGAYETGRPTEPLAGETAAPSVSPEAETPAGDSKIALSWLRLKGVEPETVKADLLSRPELIPFQGVLGGTPAFLPEETRILSEDWVYTRAEDGHIAGYILYRYRIGDDKSITWSLVGYDTGEGFRTEAEK